MSRVVKIRSRRRREGKTDYRARMALLKSNIPRIIIRKTNKYMIIQIVVSKEAQDSVKVHVNSKELTNFGWKFSFKNLPAGYLSGLLLAKKAVKAGIKKVILDSGLITSTKESKIYAVIKGALDGGLEIPCSEEILPSEKRISGKHILKKGDEISKLFEDLKNKIIKG